MIDLKRLIGLINKIAAAFATRRKWSQNRVGDGGFYDFRIGVVVFNDGLDPRCLLA